MKNYKWISNIGKKNFLIIMFFSICLSSFFTIGRKIVFETWVSNGYDANYIKPIQLVDIFFWGGNILFFTFFLIVILLLVRNFAFKGRGNQYKQKKLIFACTACLLFLGWMPYILSFYPGSVLGDSLASIYQVLNNYQDMNNHHPIIYTIFVGIFINIGIGLGNINYGIFLYTLIQSGIMCIVIAILLQYLFINGVPKVIICIFLLYYIILPFFPSYAIIMWKDPLYSCGLLLLMLFLNEANKSRGESLNEWKWRYCGFIGMMFCFFRNNGVYVLVTCILLVALFYKSKAKKVIGFSVAIIGIYLVIIHFLFPVLNVKTDYEENVGIPLQQIARVIVYDGEISEDEKEFLFHILPEEKWKESYSPCLVDSIKWNEAFDASYLSENRGEFFKIWLSLFEKNIKLYLEAYIMNTFGFWQIGEWNGYGYIDIYISDNDYGIENADLFQKFTGFSIQERLRQFIIPVGEGWFAWVMLISLCLSICKSFKSVLTYIPPLANWLTILLATPVAFSLRYVYILALALPMLLCLPVLYKDND